MAEKVPSAAAAARFAPDRLAAFAKDIFRAAGSDDGEAAIIADHLVEANLVGHDSHGVVRIRKYVDWARAGMVIPNRHAELVIDRGVSALVDGGFGYGQVIGKEAMEIAAERAHAGGFALIAIRNAGHLGRIGAWPEMLAKAGLVSFHFVNTSGFGILVAPHGGRDRRLSANPIAAGAPVDGGPPLILDIATSIVAEGKIQVARNKGEKLAPGLVLDGAGPPDHRSGSVLRQSARRDLSLRRPQGIGPVVLLRDPRRLADRRLQQPPVDADRRTPGQQHDVDRHRSGGLRRGGFLPRRRRAAGSLDQGLAAARARRLGAPARRDRAAHPARA